MPLAGRFIAAIASCVLMGPGSTAAETPMLKASARASSKLVISGSSSMAPMMLALGERFSGTHPGLQVEVRAEGSGQGIADVSRGKADIGMASRLEMTKTDGLETFAIARDGVCVAVHKDNPVRSLSNRQVLDIFTGRITNWSAVGGRDTPIVVLNAPEASGTVELFTHYFNVKHADIKAQLVATSTKGRVKVLSENPAAIAYISVGSAQVQMDAGAPIRLLPADGIAATTKNIRSGNFPLSRPLLLLTREHPTGVAREFIAFSLSSQATDLVRKHGFLPYLD